MTNDGHNTDYVDPKKSPTKLTTFGGESRFSYIHDQVRRTGNRVGPGSYASYSSQADTNKNYARKFMRETVVKNQMLDYFYVGDSIVNQQSPWRPMSREALNRTIGSDHKKNNRSNLNRSFNVNEASISLQPIPFNNENEIAIIKGARRMHMRNSSMDKSKDETKIQGSNNLVDAAIVYNSIGESSINSNHKKQLEKELEKIQKMNERSLLIKYSSDKKTSAAGTNNALAGEETMNFQGDNHHVSKIKSSKNKKERSKSNIHESYKSNAKVDNSDKKIW